MVSLWEFHDFVMDGSHLGRSVHIVISSVLKAVFDVLRDGPGKQHTLLAHDSNLAKKYIKL